MRQTNEQPMNPSGDLRDILGMSVTSTAEEIRYAYDAEFERLRTTVPENAAEHMLLDEKLCSLRTEYEKWINAKDKETDEQVLSTAYARQNSRNRLYSFNIPCIYCGCSYVIDWCVSCLAGCICGNQNNYCNCAYNYWSSAFFKGVDTFLAIGGVAVFVCSWITNRVRSKRAAENEILRAEQARVIAEKKAAEARRLAELRALEAQRIEQEYQVFTRECTSLLEEGNILAEQRTTTFDALDRLAELKTDQNTDYGYSMALTRCNNRRTLYDQWNNRCNSFVQRREQLLANSYIVRLDSENHQLVSSLKRCNVQVAHTIGGASQ